MRREKTSRFYWWLISYFVVIVLSVSISVAGYFASLRVLKEEVQKNNKEVVERIRYACDEYLDHVRSNAFALLSSNVVRRIEKSYVSDYERTMLLEMLIFDLNWQNTRTPYDSCIIFKDKDICAMTNVGASKTDVAFSFFSSLYGSKQAWIDDVFSQSGARFVLYNLPSGQRRLFLVYYIPTIQKDVAVMTEISSTDFSALLASGGNAGEIALVTDEAGNLIFSNCEVDLAQISLESPTLNVRIEGAEYATYLTRSQIGPFSYARMVSMEFFQLEIRRLQQSFALWNILCVLIVGLLAYGFSVLNDRAVQRKDRELQKHREIIKKDTLLRILTGKSESMDDPFIREIQSAMQSALYAVILFEETAKKNDAELPGQSGSHSDTLYEYLARRFHASTGFVKARFCVIDGMLAGAVGLHTEGDFQLLQQGLWALCDTVANELGIDLLCNISRCVYSFDRLSEAYEQTLEISGNRFLGADRTVLLYDDILNEYPSYLYNAGDEQSLMDMIMLGQYDEAVSLVERIWDNENERMSLNMLRISISEIISTLLKAAVKIDKEDTAGSQDLYQAFSKIHHLSNWYQIKETILTYLRKLCDISRSIESSSDKAKKKYREIAEYIDENFSDPTLDVNMLANMFRVDRSWLSKKFREEIGEGIPGYIIRRRIDRAKELLKTDMTVVRIAEEVGFSSKTVYYRAFKKCEGITSNQYRQLVNVNYAVDEDETVN